MERSAGKGTLVHFRCTNPAHAQPIGQPSDSLTLNEGLWAYCAYDVRAGDHEWTETGGLTLEQLKREPPRDRPSSGR